ncbi:MAG TPA: GAF domain-containing sensor histidine kinase [Roseiflexaceae bacterium]|nr:GAF domain-containing sensor histidine kinase [Roseiflexaceae bacterium]
MMKHPRLYARHQAALVALIQSVLANTDLATLLRHTAALVADTLAVAYSAIWELQPDRSAFMLRACVGWQADAIDQATVAVTLPHPICICVRSAEPMVVPDWPSEVRFQQLPLLRDRGVVSSICVGIPGPSRSFGALSVDVTASRLFSNEEVNFLHAVANLLALAMTHMHSMQTLDRRIEERTHAIEQQLVIAAQQQAVLEERQRLARDLHDSVTQSLYGITLHAQAARRLLAAGDVTTATDSLHALQDTAQEALDEMRLLIFELRPPILEQVGLVAAVQARLNAVEGRANLQTRLVADESVNLPSSIEQALYRIALEALNNVLKHARAQRITVQLWQTQRAVTLEIVDDGVGFDPAAVSDHGGLGLRGMAERVAQLGGQLRMQSAPGAGTQLRVEIGL